MRTSVSKRSRWLCVLCLLLWLGLPSRARSDEPPAAKRSRISGRVIDEDGKPVADYVVQGVPPAGAPRTPQERPRATTDAEGRFELRDLQSGVYSLYAGDSKTHAKMDPRPIRAGSADVSIQVLRYRVIAGIARSPEGQPLVSCVVRVGRKPPYLHARIPDRTPAGERFNAHTRTDENGRFRIERYPSDQPVRVWIEIPPARARELLPIVRDGIVPGSEILEFVALVAPILAGIVRDDAGAPVAGATITIRGPTLVDGFPPIVRAQGITHTDAEGRFVYRPLPPGVSLSLYIKGPSADYYSERLEEVIPGAQDIGIVLRRAHAIEGEVVGVPPELLRGMEVVAHSWGGKSVRFAFSGETRHFRLSPLRRGVIELRIDRKRSKALIGPREKLLVDAPALGVRLHLAEAHTLDGSVVRIPQAGRIRVTYYDAWGRHREPQQLFGATGGSYKIPDVPAGPGQLFAVDRDRKFMALLDDVDPTTGHFVLELAPGRTISGRIEGLPGAAKIGSVVARRGHFSFKKRLASDGRFETDPLPAGRWTLEFNVGDPVGGIVPTLTNVEAGAREVIARWSPDQEPPSVGGDDK